MDKDKSMNGKKNESGTYPSTFFGGGNFFLGAKHFWEAAYVTMHIKK